MLFPFDLDAAITCESALFKVNEGCDSDLILAVDDSRHQRLQLDLKSALRKLACAIFSVHAGMMDQTKYTLGKGYERNSRDLRSKIFRS